MIEIRVSNAEAQAAVGVALITGAIGFGNWPYKVTRAWPGGGGPAGASGAGTSSAGSNGNTPGSGASGGGSAGSCVTGAGCSSATPGAGSGPGGGAGRSWGEAPVFTEDLRRCCATPLAGDHLAGCDEAGKPSSG